MKLIIFWQSTIISWCSSIDAESIFFKSWANRQKMSDFLFWSKHFWCIFWVEWRSNLNFGEQTNQHCLELEGFNWKFRHFWLPWRNDIKWSAFEIIKSNLPTYYFKKMLCFYTNVERALIFIFVEFSNKYTKWTVTKS